MTPVFSSSECIERPLDVVKYLFGNKVKFVLKKYIRSYTRGLFLTILLLYIIRTRIEFGKSDGYGSSWRAG